MQWHRIPDQGTQRRPRRSGLIYSTSCASFILAQRTNGAGLPLAAVLWLENLSAISQLHCKSLDRFRPLAPNGLDTSSARNRSCLPCLSAITARKPTSRRNIASVWKPRVTASNTASVNCKVHFHTESVISGLYDLDGMVAVGNGSAAGRLPSGLEGSVLYGRERSGGRVQSEARYCVAEEVRGIDKARFCGVDEDAGWPGIDGIGCRARYLRGVPGGAINRIGAHVVSVIVCDVDIDSSGIDLDRVRKIVSLEGGLQRDQRSVQRDLEPDHLVGGAIGDVEPPAGWIAGDRVGCDADGKSAERGEAAAGANLKTGDCRVTLVDGVNISSAGHDVDRRRIVAHREKTIAAICDRGAQA